ncbi:MAG: hypothetical protein ACXABO_01630 [Promethearchaeota archaeon]
MPLQDYELNQFSHQELVFLQLFQEEIKQVFRDNYLSNSYQYIWINTFGSERID